MNAPTMTILLPADLATLPEAKVHWLPCTVHADREAKVDMYFLPQQVPPSHQPSGAAETGGPAGDAAPSSVPTTESSQYRASFRGRRLDGQVPHMHGFSAFVVETSEVASQDQDQSRGEIDGDEMDLDAAQNSTPPTLRLTPVARVVDPVVWDHDQLPLVHTSAVLKGLEWAWLASAVHQPVSMEDDATESAATSK